MRFPTIGGSFHSVEPDASPEYTHAVPGTSACPRRALRSAPAGTGPEPGRYRDREENNVVPLRPRNCPRRRTAPPHRHRVGSRDPNRLPRALRRGRGQDQVGRHRTDGRPPEGPVRGRLSHHPHPPSAVSHPRLPHPVSR